MYVPSSALGDPAPNRKPHPHPRLWWRVPGSVANFLRPTEHFSPHTVLAVRFRGPIILGISIPFKKPSLRSLSSLQHQRETGREQALIFTYGLKLIWKYMKEKEETEWTQPSEASVFLFTPIYIF